MELKEIALDFFPKFTMEEKTQIKKHFENLTQDSNQVRFFKFKLKKVISITDNLLWVVMEKKTKWAAWPNKGKLYNFEQKVYYIQKDSCSIHSTGFTHSENTYQGFTLTGTTSGAIWTKLDYIYKK